MLKLFLHCVIIDLFHGRHLIMIELHKLSENILYMTIKLIHKIYLQYIIM